MTVDNLMAVAQATRRYNFHSHSEFCDGRAPIAVMAERAAAEGFTHFGFSPHSPVPIASPCNMEASDIDAYFAEIDKARPLHSPVMTIYRAMEIDFLGDAWGPSNPFFTDLRLDYAIGSVHFIPADVEGGFVDVDGNFESFNRKMERHFAGDIRHVVESFYAQSRRMLELGGFEIIGHFDKIGHNASHYQPGIEQTAWYRTLVNDLIDLIAEKGVIAEVNTKAWEGHGRLFPAPEHFERMLRLGIPVVVDSDAHYPDLLNAARDVAFSHLASAGYPIP